MLSTTVKILVVLLAICGVKEVCCAVEVHQLALEEAMEYLWLVKDVGYKVFNTLSVTDYILVFVLMGIVYWKKVRLIFLFFYPLVVLDWIQCKYNENLA